MKWHVYINLNVKLKQYFIFIFHMPGSPPGIYKFSVTNDRDPATTFNISELTFYNISPKQFYIVLSGIVLVQETETLSLQNITIFGDHFTLFCGY